VPKRGAGATYYGYQYQGEYQARPAGDKAPTEKVDAR
jgi:hypothetical protein